MAEILSYFLLTITFLVLLIATLTDLKKREVPNWLNFATIALALLARLIYSFITENFSFFLYGLLYTAIFFLIAHALYYGRIFAGGDAKLLIALGALLAEPPIFNVLSLSNTFSLLELPFSIVFLVNLFVAGSFYGMIMIFVYTIKNKKVLENFKERIAKTKYIFLTIIPLIASVIFLFLKIHLLVFISAILFFLPFFFMLTKAVEKEAMILKISSSRLTEGDWLASPVKIGRKVIMPNWEGLTREELSLIRKSKKKVLVKYGLPFVPAFLLAFILSLLIGNVFEIFLR